MTEFILRVITWGGYWGIVLLMALENVVPPVPSEVIMGFGGIAAARGTMEFWLLVAAGTVGTVLGNYFWFLVGVRLGYQRLRPFVDRWGRWLTVDWEDIEKANRLFHRHGGKIVFVFRFLPTFRTMVSLPAGLTRMGHARFLVFTAAGSAIWNLALAAAGYWLGTRFSEMERLLGPASVVLIVGIVLFYLWRVATWTPRAAR